MVGKFDLLGINKKKILQKHTNISVNNCVFIYIFLENNYNQNKKIEINLFRKQILH